MMNPKFDRRRPHGTINPPYNGALFSQDGAYFDSSGRFLFWEGEQPGADPSQTAGKPHMVDAVRRALNGEAGPRLSAEEEALLDLAGKVLPGLLKALAAMDATDQTALLEALTALDTTGGEDEPADEDAPAQTDLNATRIINNQAPEPGRAPSENVPPMVKPEEDNQQAADDVDLAAWAKGEKQYQFFRVKAAAQSVSPAIVLTNSKTVAEGLVNAGIVAAEDVKR